MVHPSSWQTLTSALRELHRVLVERARRDHERDQGASLDPAQLLQLLTSDHRFEWLRSLSELMADIDGVRDAEPAVRDEFSDAVRATVEHMITPPSRPETADAFARRYWPYMHEDPAVAIAHAQVRRALAGWPRSQEVESKSALDERRRLAEHAEHQAQRNRRRP